MIIIIDNKMGGLCCVLWVEWVIWLAAYDFDILCCNLGINTKIHCRRQCLYHWPLNGSKHYYNYQFLVLLTSGIYISLSLSLCLSPNAPNDCNACLLRVCVLCHYLLPNTMVEGECSLCCCCCFCPWNGCRSCWYSHVARAKRSQRRTSQANCVFRFLE